MAPLSCAPVTDLYGSNFGMNPEQIVQQTLKNNEKCAQKNSIYQEKIKENEILGNSDKSNNKYIQKDSYNNDDNVKYSKRIAFTDINNKWPSNQGFSMYNRFQNPFQLRENFSEPKTDSDCLRQLVSLVKELLLVIKIIMLVLILLFVIKILEKKN